MNKRYLSIINLALIILLTSLLLLGCDNNEKSISTEQWIEDIDYLAEELPKRQIDFDSITDEYEFNQEIEALKKDVPKLNDDEIVIELRRIVASLGVSHTVVISKYDYYYPIKFYWFEEGIYLINTTEEYKKALNSKLIKVNGMDIDEIVETISPIISAENDTWLKVRVIEHIKYSDVLYGLGITDTKESATFTFENLNGEVFDIIINAFKDLNEIEYIVDSEELPYYIYNKSEEYYWYKYLPEQKAVYFQYNLCYDMEEKSFSDFNKELFDFIENNSVDKLIVDLRRNIGGSSNIFVPFVEEIKKDGRLNNENNLYVLVGRETYSSGVSAAVDLFSFTNATLIGEQMGGERTLYGNTKSFILKNSGITVDYTVKKLEDLYIRSTFIPDITVEYSVENYLNGIDPAMELIFSQY